MSDKLDKDAIIKNNPKIDRELLEKALALIEQVGKMGISPVGNKYVPPYKHTFFNRAKKEKEMS